MEVNEEKRKKFMEYAGKRVNNVLHDIQILEPMSRSSSYDFTKQDVEEMFTAMQESLDTAKAEFYKKFEEKSRSEKKIFTFGASSNVETTLESTSTLDTAPSAETEVTYTTSISETSESTTTETTEVL